MFLLNNNYTSTTVPPELLALPVKNNVVYVDVLKAGPLVGTNLDVETAEDRGLVKNHWVWRVLVDGSAGSVGQIQFGFSLERTPSVPSDAAQYVPSTRASSGSGAIHSKVGSEEADYSDVENVDKPPTVNPVEVGVANIGVVDDVTKPYHDDTESIAASSLFSISDLIYQRTEGAPAPGTLEIATRTRTEPPWSTCLTRSFALATNTTFGALLTAMTSRNMEPFRFRKIGVAFLGCRDGISQAAAAWQAEGYMPSLICLEDPHEHLYDLLCWRYSRPLVSEGLSDTSSDQESLPDTSLDQESLPDTSLDQESLPDTDSDREEPNVRHRVWAHRQLDRPCRVARELRARRARKAPV
ncbi:hypothetical protein FRC01_002540 [Tulasnella sp. 417]|nr:hypothetical protein FRC01_002540 [Tulasnella sp. 417]